MARSGGPGTASGAVGVLAVAGAGLSGAVQARAGSGVGSVVSEGSLQLPVTKSVVRAPHTQDSPSPSRSPGAGGPAGDRKSTRLNSSHRTISYAVFCLKKKKKYTKTLCNKKKKKKK